jgi:ADP-heptose:LPS heptosyltransferase
VSGRILVIKLGALGDFVQALGPMAAIRHHHAAARIVLITQHPFEALARAAGYADEIWLDERPSLLGVRPWLAMRRRLREGHFDRVYDLQTSDRSGWYFRLFWPGPWPEWSGIARGCSHPHDNPQRDFMHTIERQAEQLRIAGIADTPLPDLSWANAGIARFAMPKHYALLVPGGAAHRPAKRWPLERYAELAEALVVRALTPAIIGGAAEAPLAEAIRSLATETVDLTEKTSFVEVAALARHAALAVGNDTGPMHLIAAAGCPSVVLFSRDSDPALCAPRGPQVTLLRRPSLDELSVEEVLAALPATRGSN